MKLETELENIARMTVVHQYHLLQDDRSIKQGT